MARGDGDLYAGMSARQKELTLQVKLVENKRALSVDSAEALGFLVPSTTSARIIEKLVQVSPLRALATVEGISVGQSLKINRETGVHASGWASERATRSETIGNTVGQAEIFTHELYALLRPTYQLLEDTAFNLEAWLESRVARLFAKDEGDAFLAGTGVGKPRGLLVHPDVEVVDADASAASGEIIADDVTDLFAELETEYAQRATVLLSRATAAFLRKMVDSTNRPLDLVQRDILSQIRRIMVDGYPAVEMPGMASTGTASALVMAFGDIAEAYTIVDRQLMTVIRDPFSRKTAGEVELYYTRRTGGDVVQPDAVKILRAKA